MRWCLRCDGCGWVCEEHQDTPWDHGARACPCGAAGQPCMCNRPGSGMPRMPAGFVAEEIEDFDLILDVDQEREEGQAALARIAERARRLH